MKPSQVADLLGMATSTIRTWSMGEFKRYMSETGKGGSGERRDFTNLDVRILSYIAQLKQRGVRLEQIHQTLEQLQADEWVELPQFPEPAQSAAFPVIPTLAADTMLSAEKRAYHAEIEMLKRRIADLEEQTSEDRERIIQLASELAETKALLRLYESGRLKPEE